MRVQPASHQHVQCTGDSCPPSGGVIPFLQALLILSLGYRFVHAKVLAIVQYRPGDPRILRRNRHHRAPVAASCVGNSAYPGVGYRLLKRWKPNLNFTIVHEQEDDGRWLAEVPELPGILAYGANAQEAMSKAEALALRVIADRLEHGESQAIAIHISIPVLA